MHVYVKKSRSSSKSGRNSRSYNKDYGFNDNQNFSYDLQAAGESGKSGFFDRDASEQYAYTMKDKDYAGESFRKSQDSGKKFRSSASSSSLKKQARKI